MVSKNELTEDDAGLRRWAGVLVLDKIVCGILTDALDESVPCWDVTLSSVLGIVACRIGRPHWRDMPARISNDGPSQSPTIRGAFKMGESSNDKQIPHSLIMDVRVEVELKYFKGHKGVTKS